MKKSTLLLLTPLSLLFAELQVALVTASSQEVAPFSRDLLIESRNKAIEAREETSKLLRGEAEDIYKTRTEPKDDKQKVVIEKVTITPTPEQIVQPVLKSVKKSQKITISSQPIKTKELNTSIELTKVTTTIDIVEVSK